MATHVERLPLPRLDHADRWTVRGVLTATTAFVVIYALVVPLALLDVCVMVYQTICFPLLGIARVRRRRYLEIDRLHLGYLNALEKANCVFCGYATGVIAFVREVAARTEQYWCPIRHARPSKTTHPRHRRFAAYGDAEDYRTRLPRLRSDLRARPQASRGHGRTVR